MEKDVYQIEDFLSAVEQEYRPFVSQVHETLIHDGYKAKVESKANGLFVSYAHAKTKRSMINFLFRKKGLLMRIYADNIGKYADFIDRLPEKMEKEIGKSSVCKRLINPDDCNPRCIKGYDFRIGEQRYQKCRYSCFQFEINAESIPVLSEFVENERRERLAV